MRPRRFPIQNSLVSAKTGLYRPGTHGLCFSNMWGTMKLHSAPDVAARDHTKYVLHLGLPVEYPRSIHGKWCFLHFLIRSNGNIYLGTFSRSGWEILQTSEADFTI